MLAPGKYPITFALRSHFKEELRSKPVNWGYGGLSEFTYYRTYDCFHFRLQFKLGAQTLKRKIENYIKQKHHKSRYNKPAI